jgi:hypothetical protein
MKITNPDFSGLSCRDYTKLFIEDSNVTELTGV